jgi:radical SAM superfamily enzyme YgiQ (UPF0313 family)
MILSEGEIALREILQAYMTGVEFTGIRNTLTYNENGEFTVSERSPVDLDKLVYPPKAISYGTHKLAVHILQTSRSCVFKCSYCTQGVNQQRRVFPLDRIKANIRNLIEDGVYEYEFVDDDFLGGIGKNYIDRAWDIINIMKDLKEEYKVELKFRIFTNPYIVSSNKQDLTIIKDLLKGLKEAGLIRVYLGIESGSEEQRKRYNRLESLEDCEKSLEMLQELGFAIDAGFIMFDPEVTVSDLKMNIGFINKTNLIRFNTWPYRSMCLTAYTPMYERVKELGMLLERDNQNPISFKYNFMHPEIGIIVNELDSVAEITAKVFYILKYFYKEYCYKSEIKETLEKVSFYLRTNALYNINFLGNIIDCYSDEKSVLRHKTKLLKSLHELNLEIKRDIHIFDNINYSTNYLLKSIDTVESQIRTYL